MVDTLQRMDKRLKPLVESNLLTLIIRGALVGMAVAMLTLVINMNAKTAENGALIESLRGTVGLLQQVARDYNTNPIFDANHARDMETRIQGYTDRKFDRLERLIDTERERHESDHVPRSWPE